MDYETVPAATFGASLRGVGLNLLSRDVLGLAAFLTEGFEMKAHRLTADFAIMTYGDDVFQLHADHTYHSHPLPSLLPEAGARGAGLEIRLYDTDPDAALARLERGAHEATVLQPPKNQMHGLRECVILSADGYAWLPSRPLSEDELAALREASA